MMLSQFTSYVMYVLSFVLSQNITRNTARQIMEQEHRTYLGSLPLVIIIITSLHCSFTVAPSPSPLEIRY
jgi:hypothetical protein